jgi:L-alanine-DL-glutamate epimerase-like enolase superfamily enzyme
MRRGAYMPPEEPGFSIEMQPETLARFVQAESQDPQAIAAQ